MTSWIARHAEALWEASQALRKVEKSLGARINIQGSIHNVGCHGVQLLGLETHLDNKDEDQTWTFLMTMVDW